MRTLVLCAAVGLVAFSSSLDAEAQEQLNVLPPLPKMLSFDLDAIDPSVNACDDFYKFACGGWEASNPMPPDESFWSRPFSQFSRQVEDYSRALIEAASQPHGERTPDERRVGDYYAACMDTLSIERRRLAPLQEELSLIDGMRSIEQLPSVLGRLHRVLPYATNDGEPLLLVYATSDPVDGGQVVRLWIAPSGTGLPGRDYYLANDSSSVVLRRQYGAHLETMFELLGEPRDVARRNAAEVLRIETALAKAQIPNEVLRNDPDATTNPTTPEALQNLTPNFRWTDFFGAHEIQPGERINVTQPTYFAALDSLLIATPIDSWKSYLRSQLFTERTKLLPSTIRQTRFAFFGPALLGQEVAPDRGRRCISHLKRDLPQSLSRVFMARAFRPEVEGTAIAMFEEIREVFRQRLENAEWLNADTKQNAMDKLDAIRLVIGGTGEWLDNQEVVVRRDDFYGNVRRIGTASRQTDFAGIGLPADISDWDDPATYIGAGYSSRLNLIRVTAGMMLYVDDQSDDGAAFFGGLGHMLAHELLHAFDPFGRNFDSAGRLRNWWTEADAGHFEDGSECVAKQYSGLEYAPGIKINGSFVVSEQVAELSAWSIAAEAYENTIAKRPAGVIAGYTPLQRYFITSAQVWCATATDAAWRSKANGSSSKAWAGPMVNGTVQNLPEFREAFSCNVGQAMTKSPEAVCKVW